MIPPRGRAPWFPHRMIMNPNRMIMNPNLTSAQAAAFLGVKVATLSDWRYRGRGPRYVKMGRRVHYRYSDIVEFRDKCLV